MPKSVFWPATLVVMGLIFLASNMRMLPPAFWNFWPLVLIIVGLGGLLTADREEWLVDTSKKSVAKVQSASKAAKSVRTASASVRKQSAKKVSTKKSTKSARSAKR